MDRRGTDLLATARASIAAHLAGDTYAAPRLSDDGPHGCFVTLWAPGKRLRGCIGHIEPTCERLADEVAECAVLAATRDPRFPPLTAGELTDTTLEISVLNPPEPVDSLETLDPRRFGVVVSCGRRRGVLLPDVRGVDTVADQIRIAMRKGHIRSDDPWVVERFTVSKFSEE